MGVRGGAWLVASALSGCYQGLGLGGAGDDASDGGGSAASDDDGSGGVEVDPIGAQPMHRLNRLEYDNTVRDLLGTELRPAQGFGPDPEANGFDNQAEQLGISAMLVDGYAAAARDAIADAIDLRPVYRVRRSSTELGVVGGYAIGELWALSGAAVDVTVDVPVDGEAQIVLSAGISVVGGAAAPEAVLELDGVGIATFAVQGSGAIPADHTFAVTLATGSHHIRVIPTNFVNSPEINVSNNVFVAGLRVESIATTYGPGRDRVFVCEPTGGLAESCYHRILETFAYRAWRRPLRPAEKAELRQLFTTIRAGGETDDDALRLVMRAIMISPKFLYRVRTAVDDDGDGWLDDYVLASRLSYFLWSSMPDDRLFEMAEQGRLASDEGLSEAVTWMLADPKSQALVDGFAEQWLSTRYLAIAQPSPEVYPEFDAALRADMIAESKLFFADYLYNELPVGSMLLPDFAYRNDRLAAHYGLPPVAGPTLLREKADGHDRRGLLMLGAWLTAQSDAEHSSPIRRGRWLSDRLLCSPVPPPPAGLVVNPLELDDAASVREQLEMHRSDPQCATCHKLLDVLGIGFEAYDGIARPRPEPGIDDLGELPDGTTFDGAEALARLYLDSDVFVGCLSQKLFVYAVGRGVELSEREALASIGAAAAARGDDLPALIDAIVHTPAFRSPADLDGGP